MGYAIRTDRYRYVEWRSRKDETVVARQLYDHRTDPDEDHNVADDPARTSTVAGPANAAMASMPRMIRLEAGLRGELRRCRKTDLSVVAAKQPRGSRRHPQPRESPRRCRFGLSTAVNRLWKCC
jgi:hypothetical protein